jgi:hypothetical protein
MKLLRQIEALEKACHAALSAPDEASVIGLLMQTLNIVRFSVSDSERPVVRGMANVAAAHAQILLRALNTDDAPSIHDGLSKLRNSLIELREVLQAAPDVDRGRQPMMPEV